MFVIKKKEIKKAIYIKNIITLKKIGSFYFWGYTNVLNTCFFKRHVKKLTVVIVCWQQGQLTFWIQVHVYCLVFISFCFWDMLNIKSNYWLSDLLRIKKQADCVNCFWKNCQPLHEKTKKTILNLRYWGVSSLQNYSFIS